MSDTITQNELKMLFDDLNKAIDAGNKQEFITIMTTEKSKFNMKIPYARGNTLNHSIARAVDDNYCSNKQIDDCDECIVETQKMFGYEVGKKPFKISQFIVKNEDVLKEYKNLFKESYKKIVNDKGKTPDYFADKCNKTDLYKYMNDNNNNSDNSDNSDNNNNNNNNYNNQAFKNFEELYVYYKTNPTLLNEPIIFKVLGKEDNGGNIFKISSSDISLYSNEKKMSNETTLRIEEKPVYTASNFKKIMVDNNNELDFDDINFITIKCQCLEDDIEVTSYANETAKHADYKTTTYIKNCDRINIHGDKKDDFNFYYYINSNKRYITLELVDQSNYINSIENGGKKSRKTRKSRKSRKSRRTRKSRKTKKTRRSSQKKKRSHRR